MNKQTIISCLRGFAIPMLALVAMAGQGQIRYRLEGTIGDSTLNTRLLLNQGMSATKMVNATIDTLEVMNGKLIRLFFNLVETWWPDSDISTKL